MTLREMLDLAERHYGGSPHIRLIKAMIGNTQIEERRFALPPGSFDTGAGLSTRAALYLQHALPMACEVTGSALSIAGLRAAQIDMIILASCTGFVMPSLDAYMIHRLGFRPTVKRMPLAQLGCAAGVSALMKATEYCRAFPDARVLVVCVELSSLCFFPEHSDISSAVCASIFGDGAAACVVSGPDGGPREGLRLQSGLTYTEPNSEHYIRYAITDRGYHLTLDREVMHVVPRVAPLIAGALADDAGITPRDLDFVLAHTGGRRILDALVESLGVDPALVENSRASLREVGNTASVSILDVIRRAHEKGRPGARSTTPRALNGILVAFGPGFTMDAMTARWV